MIEYGPCFPERAKVGGCAGVWLQALGVNKGLIVTAGRNVNVEKSTNNLEGIKALHANYLNIRDIFKYDHLVMSVDALDVVKAWLG